MKRLQFLILTGVWPRLCPCWLPLASCLYGSRLAENSIFIVPFTTSDKNTHLYLYLPLPFPPFPFCQSVRKRILSLVSSQVPQKPQVTVSWCRFHSHYRCCFHWVKHLNRGCKNTKVAAGSTPSSLVTSTRSWAHFANGHTAQLSSSTAVQKLQKNTLSFWVFFSKAPKI